MKHQKMKWTYVGIDTHKDTHTAVFLDCFFQKLGELTFSNLPSAFDSFLSQAESLKANGTTLMFGLEDASSLGRTLAVFLINNKKPVKHVNSLSVARERKNGNITQKTDSIDAECTARVLLSKLDKLPFVSLQDKYWILRTLVVQRNQLVESNIRAKQTLHNLLTQHYPNYNKFFKCIDGKTSLAFFNAFPSPKYLENVTREELIAFLHIFSEKRLGSRKADVILSSVENISYDILEEHQKIRDDAIRCVIRQIEFYMEELKHIEHSMATYLQPLDCTLTSMAGIDTVSACQILSCIGDISKFKTPAQLARYAGIAPVTYASGKKDSQFADKRGNRELNALFFTLAVRLISPVGPNRKLINMFFYDYFKRKQAEGKTKRQAIKCVERRLVNIIWTMLTRNEEYVNPPVFDIPKNESVEK